MEAMVKDGENGRLLEEDAPKEVFAEAVREGVENPEMVEKWKTEVLKTARSYSREEIVKRMLALYETVQHEQAAGEPSDEMTTWEKLLRSLEVEWSLISQKAAAAMNTFKEENEV